MQKAQPPEFDCTMESIMSTSWEARMKKARSSEYFEGWKKVAGRKAHLIFTSIPIRGPVMPDELKEEASDLVIRLTWWQACEYMTDVEKIAACRVKREEMKEYAWALAKKAAAKEWKLVLAASK